MVYIFETQLNKSKSVEFSLTKIYGINISSSKKLCKKIGFSKNFLLSELTEDQIKSLVKAIESSKILINSDLKNLNREIKNNLIQIKSYRGLRRLARLPVRGQRTHTNAKTCRKV